MGLKFKLGEILADMDMAKNRLAVEGKIRPATIAKYVEGKMGRIEVETLVAILNTLNDLAPIVEKENAEDPKKKPYTAKQYSLEDIIEYKYDGAN
ncbi:helix-turn-helix transcriptional regulator [Rossellomorea aquimaris]|uniref:helix-turn-helix domain-containing protein n=1 Tax=Rossellomorea aquimaris TaxID=189382 RepID=UPI0011E93D46|nr:helix-turn-helix transcriptional regulator [Rossellomorea aquimaris]TYS88980.1 helix-turn-helix domain-containing protein [Rossellomorea aquimaris]